MGLFRDFLDDLKATRLSPASIASKLLTGQGTVQTVAIARLSMACWRSPVTRPFAHLLHRANVVLNSVDIHPSAEIGGGFVLVHGLGTVIGGETRIGRKVTIYQNVTLGARNRFVDGRQMPSIGENTMVFAGACILGPIDVGARCHIGANAVVLKDVPDFSVAAGVPAKIVPRRDPTDPAV